MIKTYEIYCVFSWGDDEIYNLYITKEEAQTECEDLNKNRSKKSKKMYEVKSLYDAIDLMLSYAKMETEINTRNQEF